MILICPDHPDEEVFMKVEIHRSYVDRYGRAILGGDSRRRTLDLKKSTSYFMYVCIGDDGKCDDLVGKSGDSSVVGAFRRDRRKAVKQQGGTNGS